MWGWGPFPSSNDIYPKPVLGRTALSPWGFQTAAQYWIKIVHPWVQKFYPVLGLGPGERLPCQKNPRVRNIFVRNSGAGNGCANFNLWTPEKCVRSARKTMSIKFLVLGGGGYFGFFFGGGSADVIFVGARIFLKNPEISKKTAFTWTFSRSSRKCLPSSLWRESGTQQKLFGKTCSDEHLQNPDSSSVLDKFQSAILCPVVVYCRNFKGQHD